MLALLILVGCRVGDSTTVVSTVTPFSTATIGKAITPTTTGTPTISPQVMRYQCLEIIDKLPAGDSLKGVIVYSGDGNIHSWLSNEETNETYLLQQEEGDTLWQFGVSPDGRYVKYIRSSAKKQEDQLVIATSEGRPIWSQVIDSTDWEWFDNERLVNLEFSEDGTHTLLLLNPFSGEQENLPADFPDSEMFSPNWYGHWYYTRRGLPVYDPTLTRVVYPATAREDRDEWPIMIWDMETNQEVARIVTTDYWGATPLWTPDGQQFIMATKMDAIEIGPPPNEFFAVSRDGEVQQLTQFTNSFTEIEITDNYSLSPNGKLLAFWVSVQPGPHKDSHLAVLNIETGEVTNYCVKGDPFADNAMQSSPSIWSPDSTQLLVISRIPEDTKIRRVVVVDIENNYAAQINQDMEPVGWMVAP
jgi:Tol biopolymer transport system component